MSTRLDVQLRALAGVALFILVWATVSAVAASLLVPSPIAVVQAIASQLATSQLYQNLAASLGLVVLAYAISVLVALPVALLSRRYPLFGDVMLPWHSFVRYLPVAVLVPLLLVFLGAGSLTRSALIFIGTYFQLLFMFHADLSAPEIAYHEASARTLGAKGSFVSLSITLPAALPRLLDSARIAFGWAWSYLLVAEVVNADRGIGFLVVQAYRLLAMDRLVALLVIIGAVGMASDMVFRSLRRAVCPWSAS